MYKQGVVTCASCGSDIPRGELSASEALFSFAAWLTYFDNPVTFSRRHNAALAAELVGNFCKANNLSDPRDGWQYLAVHPCERNRGNAPCATDNEMKIVLAELAEARREIDKLRNRIGQDNCEQAYLAALVGRHENALERCESIANGGDASAEEMSHPTVKAIVALRAELETVREERNRNAGSAIKWRAMLDACEAIAKGETQQTYDHPAVQAVAALRAERDRIAAEVEELEAESKTMDSMYDGLRVTYDKVSAFCGELEKRVEKLECGITEALGFLGCDAERAGDLREAIVAAAKYASIRRVEKSECISEIEAENAKLTQERDDAMGLANAALREAAEAERMNKALADALKARGEEVQQLKHKRNCLCQEVSGLEEIVKMLRSKLVEQENDAFIEQERAKDAELVASGVRKRVITDSEDANSMEPGTVRAHFYHIGEYTAAVVTYMSEEFMFVPMMGVTFRYSYEQPNQKRERRRAAMRAIDASLWVDKETKMIVAASVGAAIDED